MLSVQSYSSSPVAFRGENKENSGKTHAALKTNLTVGVLDGASAFGLSKFITRINKAILNDKEFMEYAPEEVRQMITTNANSMKKIKWTLPIIGLLLSAGVGLLIDKSTNKKRAELEEKVNSLGADKALAENKRARMSNNGNIYYETNEGKKWMSAYCTTISTVSALLSAKHLKAKAIPLALFSAAFAAVGGLVAGSISDACANKSARKAADKKASVEKTVDNVA